MAVKVIHEVEKNIITITIQAIGLQISGLLGIVVFLVLVFVALLALLSISSITILFNNYALVVLAASVILGIISLPLTPYLARITNLKIDTEHKEINVERYYLVRGLNIKLFTHKAHETYGEVLSVRTGWPTKDNQLTLVYIKSSGGSNLPLPIEFWDADDCEKLLQHITGCPSDLQQNSLLNQPSSPKKSHTSIATNNNEIVLQRNYKKPPITPIILATTLGFTLFGVSILLFQVYNHPLLLAVVILMVILGWIPYFIAVLLVQIFMSPLSSTVSLNRDSQVVTIKEKYLTYTTTSKYIWQENFCLEYAQDPPSYLRGEKVLMLTLNKVGGEPRKLPLYTSTDENELIEMRDRIIRFMESVEDSEFILG